MKKLFFYLSTISALLGICIDQALAQDKSNYKFGKLSPADFSLPVEKFDSGANAIVIADIGNTSFVGNNKGFFTLVFTRFLRVKIINKNGFDIGERQIALYHSKDGDAEKLSSLKGSTFNLENGVIAETRLDEKSIFTEKYNNNYDLRKFSMPALKEGSIFDLEYTVKSPFDFLLQPWSFQGEYPCLWSEYEVTIAPPFHYVMLQKGDQQYDVNTKKEIYSNFSIQEDPVGGASSGTNMYNISGTSIQQHWVKKNVPALHEEPYTTTLDNYNTRVAFQLNFFQWSPESERHDHLNTWSTTSKTLLEDEEFGLALNHENTWMSDDLTRITEGSVTDDEKVYRIYNFIRGNFKTVGKDGYRKESIWVHHPLKEVYKNREGNVAEINLLLTAMLRKAGIRADPMILSTRDNGIANAGYPLISEYNYVICVAYPGDKLVTLDASQPFNGFGQLPVACYNGWAHVINEEKPMALNFSADSIHETSLTSVIIINDDKGKSSGSYKEVMGKSESFDVRSDIMATSVKDYEKKTQTENGSDYSMENFGLDSLKKYEFPLTVHYDFDLKNLSSSEILYFNPMLGEAYKNNPFKSMDRHYPVEIPYLIDETYLLTMDIPLGYQVDELPKSARVNYNENEGMFEYLIQKGESNIQMRVRLKLNKAFFPVEEYNTLRDFFAYVVKKESEQIVFKKNK
jgi:hypothetical protein